VISPGLNCFHIVLGNRKLNLWSVLDFCFSAEKPEKPIGGVSSFMLTKQLSIRSNVSSPSSPESPLTPAENKPLIKYHAGDDGDEPVVFNFGMYSISNLCCVSQTVVCVTCENKIWFDLS
jgi:hypothetical protein